MDGVGAEVSQKIRSAIKAKLMEIGVYVDEELPDYVMVMVANKRSKEQMDDDLQLFLGKHTPLFTTWLHQVLQKLQEVTIANLKGVKRKVSEDSKRKKKPKSDTVKKELKKKIKIESEDDNDQDSAKATSNKEKKDDPNQENDGCDSGTSSTNLIETITIREKDSADSKSAEEQVKEKKNSSKSNKDHDENTSDSEDLQHVEDKQTTTSQPQTTSSEADDLDDDCINIRTDGELLDTAEEAPIDELQTNTRDKESLPVPKSKKSNDKKQTSVRTSPVRSKDKLKQTDTSKKTDINKQVPVSSSPPPVNKVIDARELLNRKKAAKKEAESESRPDGKSRVRSESPVRKRKSDTRDSKVYHEERDKTRRSGHNERESNNRRESRDDNRNRKSDQARDSYTTKRRDGRGQRNDSDWDNKKESSARQIGRDSSGDDWGSSRPSKVARLRDERKPDSVTNKRDSEEPRRRGGVLSQVVPRAPEPEDDVDTPMPSVVKVTPRPRRPPSQQPSSTLIMKAISEANRSLANVAPRPDSTQQEKKKPLFTRKRRQLERIPPEKIAVSISNPLALQNEHPRSKGTINEKTESLQDGELAVKSTEKNTSETENLIENDNDPAEEWDSKDLEGGSEPTQDLQEPASELDPVESLGEQEQMEEMSDPQFVVTLNGYDPDGLYSHDLGEDREGDEWLKEAGDEAPVLTSTPNEGVSPRDHHNSPIIIMNTPGINHSNLIEVELMKSKSAERCKYWPACRLTDKCTFYHPTKPCKVFPACKFGDACLYIHPQCKYNALCTRKDCVFSHSSTHTPQQPAVLPKVNATFAASSPLPCKFYPNCANTNCPFAHPQRACRYGLYCTKKDCSFDHGQVPPMDKLKWTRATAT